MHCSIRVSLCMFYCAGVLFINVTSRTKIKRLQGAIIYLIKKKTDVYYNNIGL